MRALRRALIPVLLLTGSAHAQIQEPVSEATEAPEAPDVSVRTRFDESDRFTIPTHVNGKGPFAFLVDTGSQTTIISQELASALELQPGAGMRIVSMSGPADVSTVISAVSPMAMATSRACACRYWRANLGAIGLLGVDSLQSRKLVIDLNKGTMQISESRTRPARDAIVVEGRSRFGQLVLVDSTVEGRKVAVILDTGAQHSVGNLALYTSLWKREKLARAQQITMTSVLGDPIVGHWGVVETMQVGGITINNAGVIFTDASPFETLELSDKPALLLGMDVLSGFTRIEVDFRRRQVSFYLPREAFTPAPLRSLTER